MKSAVVAPITSTNDSAVSRQLEQRRHARDHEDAGGHHRRGVDQRRDRRRAFHRVGQPHVQRHLRATCPSRRRTGRCRSTRQQRPLRAREDLDASCRRARRLREHRRVIERCRSSASTQAMPSRKPKSPTRLTRNAFRFAKIARRPRVPEADQQVRDEAHRFPAEEQLQEVVAHHQHQHREREQRDVAEEALVARVVGHVADGVDVHHQRHERHDHHHQSRSGGRPGSRSRSCRLARLSARCRRRR